MNIGFIGIGHMGQAIIRGLLNAKVVSANQVFISNRTKKSRLAFAAQTGVTACASNKEVARHSDILFLAAKPTDIPTLLTELAPFLSTRPTIVSLAAGLSLENLHSALSLDNYPLVRIMPNLNHEIGEGMAALCSNAFVSTDIFSFIQTLFDEIGETVVLPEEQFSVYAAIAGCSPAFTFMYIDALALAGVRYGLKKEVAVKIATQAVMGSAKLVFQSDSSPMDLADQVASPGGTTIEGVLTLLDTGFPTAVIKAVEAAYEKDVFLFHQDK